MIEYKDTIHIEWHIDDVKKMAKLTDDQARKVLFTLKDNHDASIGINWDVIVDTINDLRRTGEFL